MQRILEGTEGTTFFLDDSDRDGLVSSRMGRHTSHAHPHMEYDCSASTRIHPFCNPDPWGVRLAVQVAFYFCLAAKSRNATRASRACCIWC